MNKNRLLFLIILAGLIAVGYATDVHTLLTLENAKHWQQSLAENIENNFLLASLIYFVAYVSITALSIPGAAVATLLGAALFGFWWGLFLVSFASTIGATLAFLVSRFLLRDWVQGKFGSKMRAINEALRKTARFTYSACA